MQTNIFPQEPVQIPGGVRRATKSGGQYAPASRLSKKSSLYWAFLRKCGIMDAGDENVRRKEK